MMKIFHHRINTSAQLVEIPSIDGVEIDIRSSGQDIILEHDPFKEGQLFTEWLKHWQDKGMDVDIKVLNRSLVALQGPKAAQALKQVAALQMG